MKPSEALNYINIISEDVRNCQFLFNWTEKGYCGLSGLLEDVTWCKMVCDYVLDENQTGLLPKLIQLRSEVARLMEIIKENDNYMPWEDEATNRLYECCNRMMEYIDDVALCMVADGSSDDSGKGHRRAQVAVKPSFRSLIQHPDKDGLLKRLHDLIDKETRPSMVGAIFLRASAAFESLLKEMPGEKEVCAEFPNCEKMEWRSIVNYMNSNSQKALDKANKLYIFTQQFPK